MKWQHWYSVKAAWIETVIYCSSFRVKAGLHRNVNVACENDAYVYVSKFVDRWAFAEAANRSYINVLYTNSLWCTDSRRIAFRCSPNIRRTAKCCLPRLRKTSTSNVHIIFACCIRVCILFAFRCKRGLSRRLLKWLSEPWSHSFESPKVFLLHHRLHFGGKSLVLPDLASTR